MLAVRLISASAPAQGLGPGAGSPARGTSGAGAGRGASGGRCSFSSRGWISWEGIAAPVGPSGTQAKVKGEGRAQGTARVLGRRGEGSCDVHRRRGRGETLRRGCQAAVSGQEAMDTASNTSNATPSAEVLRLWRTADAVCFDVDSTVCTDEGIDELAAHCGAGEAVAAWTTRAMTGNVPFHEALAARLDIMKPSARQLAEYLHANPPKVSPGIEDLVKAIKARGAEVYLISGGFRQMIEPVAALLGIPKANIFANRLLFDATTGEYAGFDEAEPTSRAGGKATAIRQLKAEHGYGTLIMLGDGATDLEARQPGGADAFVGYGGVHVRPTVKAGADWFVTDFQPLIKALQ